MHSLTGIDICAVALTARYEDSRLGTSYTDYRINEEELFTKIVDKATE